MGHIFEILLTLVTAHLSLNTYRALPEDQKHQVRKAARVVHKHSMIVLAALATIGAGVAAWHHHEVREQARRDLRA